MITKFYRHNIGKAVIGFGLIFVQTLFGQVTNQPVLQVSKIGAEDTAVLSWNSNTNEIYSLLYSTNLTSDWSSAVANLPNQGTNTIWSDCGGGFETGSRLSSADVDAPIRFYRLAVQGYTSNNFPAAITFSNITDGTVLSEFTNVLAGAVSDSNIISGKLSVDGNEVAFGTGGAYDFAFETRLFPNGTHRLSITVEDNGDSGTTGGDDPGGPEEGTVSTASYATKNISVVFSNFLANVWLKHQSFRPETGQTQEIRAIWATPRDWQVNITAADDTNTIYRAFGGSGTKIVILWDGLDSNGNQLDPQRIAYVIQDLGETQQSQAVVESSPSSLPAQIDIRALIPPPLPWDTNYWSVVSQTTVETIEPEPQSRSTVTRDSATDKSLLETATASALTASASNEASENSSGTYPPFIIYAPYKVLGTFGMLYQGHHPWFSPANRPPRGLPFGQVSFASNHNPPWGLVKAAKRIANTLGPSFWVFGYQINFMHGDDDVEAAMLQKASLGGQNILNNVNLGLYVGHSAAGKENIVALGHPQSYIPIYNSFTGTMSWVGMNDMSLGSSNLKWMAFYSCNLFRSSSYRTDGIYDVMKNNNHLGMNANLHIMQAYATEMTVRSDMGKFWTKALMNLTGIANDSTVLGAWKYVCINTQPRESVSAANVSRSAYWPECAGDHIYGYGSQTDPDPDYTQGELLEDDQLANTTP